MRNTDDADKELDVLEERSVEISKTSTSFPNDEKSMKKWEIHVLQEHGHEIQA